MEEEREGGLYWPGPQQLPVHTPQITMEIYISDWIHKFQNKTGLDAKANLELHKSKRVCSVGTGEGVEGALQFATRVKGIVRGLDVQLHPQQAGPKIPS
jgi:hypothetical protein